MSHYDELRKLLKTLREQPETERRARAALATIVANLPEALGCSQHLLRWCRRDTNGQWHVAAGVGAAAAVVDERLEVGCDLVLAERWPLRQELVVVVSLHPTAEGFFLDVDEESCQLSNPVPVERVAELLGAAFATRLRNAPG